MTDPIKSLQDFLEAVDERDSAAEPVHSLAWRAALIRGTLQIIVGDVSFAGDPKTIEAVNLALETHTEALTDAVD